MPAQKAGMVFLRLPELFRACAATLFSVQVVMVFSGNLRAHRLPFKSCKLSAIGLPDFQCQLVTTFQLSPEPVVTPKKPTYVLFLMSVEV